MDTKITKPVSLLWCQGKFNDQLLYFMLDSGCTTSVIAKRVVTSNNSLKNLERKPVDPNTSLYDANGQPLQRVFILNIDITLGDDPAVSVNIDITVCENLPYSCIIGLDVVNNFKKWGVDNSNRLVLFEDIKIPFVSTPNFSNKLCFLSTSTVVIPPKETVFIRTRPNGSALDADRPITCLTTVLDGHSKFEIRTGTFIHPTLYNISNHTQDILIPVTNTTNQQRTINRKTNLAVAEFEYIRLGTSPDKLTVNSIQNSSPEEDPIRILCKNMKHLTPSEIERAQSVLEKHRSVFSISGTSLGKTHITSFDIDTSNITPVSVPLRRVPLHRQDIVRQLLEKYEHLGIIEQIDSPYRAATVLVEKKNVGNGVDVTDRYRLCVDYRRLNKIIPDSGWPSPSLDQCLDSVAGSQYLSALDFNSGYHQIPCTNRAKEALAFAPGYGFPQYTFNVMPMGIKPASHKFQRTMESIFSDMPHRILPPFFDDIIVKGKTFSQALQNLDCVLERVAECGFTLNALKCRLLQVKLPYLGHIVQHGTLTIDPSRISSIINYPTPTDVKSLRRFLGMIQFCHRFIRNLNRIAAPLYKLLRISQPFNWTDQCNAAFAEIKQCLTSPPTLRSPSTSDHMIL